MSKGKFVWARESEICEGAEVANFGAIDPTSTDAKAKLDTCNATGGWHNLWVLGSTARNIDIHRRLGAYDPWCITREGNLRVTPVSQRTLDPLVEMRKLIRAWEADRDTFHASPGAVDFCHNLTPERSEAWSALLRAKVAASKRSQDEQARVVIDNDMDHLLKDVP
jgi:hypothetical protein